jgi:hypothetical protein
MLQRKLRMNKPSHRNNGRWLPRCACQCRSSIRAEAAAHCQEPLGIGAKHFLGAHGEKSSKNKKYSKSTQENIMVQVQRQLPSQVKKKRSGARQAGRLMLELIQTQMTQKPMLRAKVHARALRASQKVKRADV